MSLTYQGVFGPLHDERAAQRGGGVPALPGGAPHGVDPNPPTRGASFDPCTLPFLPAEDWNALGCGSHTVSTKERGTTSYTVTARRSIALPDPAEWGPCAAEVGGAERLATTCGSPYLGTCGPFSEAEIREANRSLDITFALPGVVALPGGGIFGPLMDLLSPVTELWESNRNAKERELLELAWTYLIQNEHLILWAACMIGDQDVGVQVVKKLTRPGKVDIVISDYHVCELEAGFCTYIDPLYLFEEVIHIGRKRGRWECYVAQFDIAPQCAAISLAGTLLHELWHMAREWALEGITQPAACFPAVLFENVLRYAMYESCAGAAKHDACVTEFKVVGGEFLTDRVVWLECP